MGDWRVRIYIKQFVAGREMSWLSLKRVLYARRNNIFIGTENNNYPKVTKITKLISRLIDSGGWLNHTAYARRKRGLGILRTSIKETWSFLFFFFLFLISGDPTKKGVSLVHTRRVGPFKNKAQCIHYVSTYFLGHH